jgi:molybdate transport system substrate-binding protein
MRRAVLLVLCLVAASLARAETITVFAAASLKEALDAVAAAFEKKSADRIVISYAGSNMLARQIENGAPAALFISADTDWIDYVEKRRMTVPNSRRELLGNELVLIAPAGSRVTLGLVPGVALGTALQGKRLAIANPDAVPAGKYAKLSLQALGAWTEVEKQLAPVDNVRGALLLVARGEAPLGIVYRTDALAEPRVRIVDTFPPGTHPPIVYPMVRVKRGDSPVAAAFGEYLASPEAMGQFERYGFRGL